MTAAIMQLNASALVLSRVRMLVALMVTPSKAAEAPRTLSKQDDAVLADVRASLEGDGEAYARIIRQYQGGLARRMTRFARDTAIVEELVHDVFVEAYFSLGKYRADAPLEHWLQKIATRVGYRYWKQRQLLRVVSFDEQAHDRSETGGTAPALDTNEQVAAALERLAPRDRLVLTLLYIEDRSVAEAADLAGWSQTMVKVQAYRARKKLQKLLGSK
jgi:RNA polymerase sigma-70 factor (ECF subfamily)